ncbi:MAG: hypothetical protein IPK67_20600 [Planctomycetes bacterium]|nr:hypothetical protein [Planctomycetota bacterium]
MSWPKTDIAPALQRAVGQHGIDHHQQLTVLVRGDGGDLHAASVDGVRERNHALAESEAQFQRQIAQFAVLDPHGEGDVQLAVAHVRACAEIGLGIRFGL